MDETNPISQLAAQVKKDVPDFDMNKVVERLPEAVKSVSTSCNERMVRSSIIKAYDRPRGFVAMLVRKKLNSSLPAEFQRRDVVDALVKAGAMAARDDNMWSLLYAAINHGK